VVTAGTGRILITTETLGKEQLLPELCLGITDRWQYTVGRRIIGIAEDLGYAAHVQRGNVLFVFGAGRNQQWRRDNESGSNQLGDKEFSV
jgi:hypothetical protein